MGTTFHGCQIARHLLPHPVDARSRVKSHCRFGELSESRDIRGPSAGSWPAGAGPSPGMAAEQRHRQREQQQRQQHQPDADFADDADSLRWHYQLASWRDPVSVLLGNGPGTLCHSERRPEGPEARNRLRPGREAASLPGDQGFLASLGMTTRPEAVEQEKTDVSAAGRQVFARHGASPRHPRNPRQVLLSPLLLLFAVTYSSCRPRDPSCEPPKAAGCPRSASRRDRAPRPAGRRGTIRSPRRPGSRAARCGSPPRCRTPR